MCADFIFWDMPFGLGLASWDTLLPDEDLDMFFKQINVVNTSSSTVIALVVHFADAGRVKKAMEEVGFGSVHPYYVYKPGQNQRGTDCFIFAVEMILIGYKAEANRRGLVFPDKNPILRHNLLFGHTLRGQRFRLSGQPEPVNTCQKHSGIAYELATIFTHPGANALVIGSGSGSDVIGCLRAQLNVVAIDKDPTQFHGCKTRLTDYKANVEVEREIEAKEIAQVKRLKQLAGAFASWEPEPVVEPEVEESVPMTPETQALLDAPEDVGAAKLAVCMACGQNVDTAESVACQLSECNANHLHAGCVQECAEEECGLTFCCPRHLQAHADEH